MNRVNWLYQLAIFLSKKGEHIMYSALDVAKYVVCKCTNDNCPISNLHLQKILYYLQRDYLRNGEALFSDEIQAWRFGPVVSEVYYNYCGYGSLPIEEIGDVEIEQCDKERVDPIIDAYKYKNPWDLVKETHKPGGAWAIVFNDGAGDNNIIPKTLIAEKG